MGIRIPLQTVLDFTDTGVGATSVVSQQFTIPQDTDNIVLKIPTASVNGTAPVVDVYLQTTDDGGTTFYDIAHMQLPSTVTSSVLAVTNAKPMITFASTDAYTASVVTTASTRGLGVNQNSGLPIMGVLGQVQVAYSGTITTNNGVRVQVRANNQSARQ